MDSPVPPVVCTLTTKAMAGQSLEWADLASLALSSVRLANGAVNLYPAADAERIEELAARELECCGTWLDISTERTDSGVRLEITTENPDGVELIHTLADLEATPPTLDPS